MMRVWSHRPQLSHLGLFFAAYVLGCGFAQLLAIVPGTGISIWPPGGLFMATLVLASRPSWPWWMLAGCLAELLSNSLWFRSPLPAAILIYIGNALEATAGAWLVSRTCKRPVQLDTLPEVLAFVVLGAGIAPVISATIGSATLAWFGMQSQSFAQAWPLWWIGDATGILIVAPLALVVLQHWRGRGQFSTTRWIEACVLGLILLGVAALSLSGYLPFAYIIMPPLLWAAVRFEFKGAVITLTLLALITAAFTISGASQFGGDPEAQRQKHVMLQLFLAVSALSALIVAAVSRQHQLALLTLRESEQKLQQMIDTVPALIWSTTRDGRPSYINKRLMDAVGVTLNDLTAPDASRSLADVHPDHRCAVEQALTRAFETGDAFAMTYRQRRSDGTYRWTEGRAEALRDEAGDIVQWYGACVDIDDRVTAEEALRRREREFSQLVNMVPSLLWRLSPDGEPIFFNKRMIDFLGLDVADADKADASRLAAIIEAVVHPDDAASVTDALNRSLATGEGFSLNYRLRRADGVYRWMSGRAEPMLDHGGRIVQWYGLSHDIDDQMHAEQALRERERELQQLIDALPTMIWAATPDGEPSYINNRLTEYVGLTLNDLDAPDIGRLQAAVQSSVHPDDAAAVQQALVHSFGTGEAFLMKYRQRRADGVYRWIQGRAEPLRDREGRIVQWYGVSFDIYEEVTAQQALRDREREFSQLVDMVPSHVWRLTPEGEPAFFNKRMVDFLGLNVVDMDKPGMSRLAALVETIIHPDDGAEVRDTLSHCLATGDTFAMRYRLRRVDGVYRWMSSRAEPLRDNAGHIVHWYGLCHDIDDQMHAEEALRRSERELQQLVDALSVHIWSWTPDGRLAYVNKRSLEDLGFSGANFEDITRVAQELVHPEDAADVLRTSANCLKTGDNFLMRYRRRWKDGSYRWIEARCEPLRDRDGTIVHWYQVSIDIDDEVRAEEALRDSKRQLEQMIDALPINILSFAPSGKITYASKRYLENVGSPMAHIQDFDALAQDLAHPEDFPAMHRRASVGFATGEPFVNRFRRRDKDGVYRWIEARARPLCDADGTIVQWYIISIDIEDEMRAQEALRERERFLLQLVQTLPAMIDCAAPDGEPIYRSQQLREFLGYQLEELDGSGNSRLSGTLDAGIHPDDVASVKEQYAHSLSTGEPYAKKHRLRRFDGEYRWVETRAAPMRNAEGVIVQWNVICLDIDGEVRMQEELRLAQEKMARASQAASLAELSASIAHEVNQPLAAIVATSHACRRWLSANPPNLERAAITLERIIRDANSASEVVSRIRALFSQMGKARSPADLADVIAEVCRLMADQLASKNIRMMTELDQSLPSALIDRIQIQQVLVNLIRNAIDSMDTAAGSARVIRLRTILDGDNAIRIEVSDLGVGMKEPERAFEPFVTTKENGMGMGLAICRSIIEAHDGRLWATRNEPRGTTLAFTLPVQTKDAA